MWEVFDRLREGRGVTVYQVAKDLGINPSMFSNWKAGRYVPKQDKLQLIADYFGVTLEYLMTGETSEYYTNPETAEMAQKIFENPDLRLLFDVAADATPEQLKLLHDLALSWKVSND